MGVLKSIEGSRDARVISWIRSFVFSVRFEFGIDPVIIAAINFYSTNKYIHPRPPRNLKLVPLYVHISLVTYIKPNDPCLSATFSANPPR